MFCHYYCFSSPPSSTSVSFYPSSSFSYSHSSLFYYDTKTRSKSPSLVLATRFTSWAGSSPCVPDASSTADQDTNTVCYLTDHASVAELPFDNRCILILRSDCSQIYIRLSVFKNGFCFFGTFKDGSWSIKPTISYKWGCNCLDYFYVIDVLVLILPIMGSCRNYSEIHRINILNSWTQKLKR